MRNLLPRLEPGSLKGVTLAFDLDGTLVDTAPDLLGTLNIILADHGLPPLPLSSASSLVGKGAKVMLERGFAAAGQSLPPDQAESLFDRFIEIYLGRIADESQIGRAHV